MFWDKDSLLVGQLLHLLSTLSLDHSCQGSLIKKKGGKKKRMGAASWSHRSQPLRKRVQALRTLWDLRWHGENKAVATQSHDPQVSALPDLSQVLVAGPCPLRMPGHDGRSDGGVHRPQSRDQPTPPWTHAGSGAAILLTTFNQPTLMAHRWSGQWDQDAIRALQPHIARCTRKQIKAVLGHIGRVTSTTASACWRLFSAMVNDLSPPADPYPPPTPMVARQTNNKVSHRR